ncbi:murein L,D-transpeptidase [Streptomyces sp. WAC05374]|uniref:L,D-transpeptidase family protein n=1 Tax=Streptomyces sp. WAC05374 TaxID=2487420 RepID=UPI000F870B05|nr:L,D-transpeptidase family protein [Streptomyces sp. WAC05374]RST00154.1 murein L,D-transpeptidase [Streptomyces sp. WAC05374]TDF37741.1 murein L,D-transpeptidase [Streptomyces sp. WAC05374]TDF45650.1 murein L,D-transpeptidase [Streptomyces sp. WAC05374]TDF46501.1 murein L,D-transpeptidase [Streptomyces sp. WAC05374]
MHRTSVIRRAVLAAAAVSLAATGCTQAVGAAGGSAPAPAASPSASASPSSGASAAGGAEPAASSPAGSASPGAAKTLMAEGTENEQVRELQARLRQLGHFHRSPTAFYGSMTAKAVSAFQKKQGLPETGTVDGTTWERLTAASRKPTAEELRPPTTNELDKPDARCMTGRVLCISKESRTLAWMIDGKVVSAMDVRFGSENTPTREGTFKVDRKERTWKSTLYHTSMPYSMFFSGGQAVHYSADFAARGYNGGSHGCVNVRDMDRLETVFEQVKVGDKVVVHW